MPDLDERFRSLARTRTPDMWPNVLAREPRTPLVAPSPRRRVAIAALAFAVAVAGVGLAVWAFRGGSEHRRTPIAPAVGNGRIAYASDGDLWTIEPDGTDARPITTGLPGFAGQPSWSPDGTHLVFVIETHQDAQAASTDSFDLYEINADGSGLTRLTTDGLDFQPSWSPDGTKIAYSHGTGPEVGTQDIWVVNPDGSDPVALTHERSQALSLSPSWSPDGRRILFVSNRTNTPQIYVMNADGTDETQLTDDRAFHANPEYSPDGTQIAFASDLDGPGIYVMNADGTGIEQITRDPQVGPLDLTWAPDGTKIVYTTSPQANQSIVMYVLDPTTKALTQIGPKAGQVIGPAWQPVPPPAASVGDGLIAFVQGTILAGANIPDAEIYLMEPDGSGVRRLTDAGADGKVAAEPAWSPDGTRIAFVLSTPEHLGAFAGDGDIYVINADGTGLTQLTEGLRDAQPAWSPDGSRILFPRDQGNSLFVMNADGSGAHELLVHGEAYPPYESPSWSPDGSRIAFQASPSRGVDTNSVYATNVDGTGTTRLTHGSSDGSPAWSPTGSMLAYAGPDGIYLLDVRTGAARRLTDCHAPKCGFDFEPSWASDVARITFSRQEGDGTTIQLFVVNADGTELRALTSGPEWNRDPSWQPVSVPESSPTPTPTETSSPSLTGAHVAATIDVGPNAQTSSILYAEGSVWITAYGVEGGGGADKAMVFRIDPATNEIVARIPVDATPTWEIGGGGIASGDGSIWVTGSGRLPGQGSGAVLDRIDPATNEVVATMFLGGSFGADVVVDDSGVWVLIFDTDGSTEVLRLDQATGEVVATIGLDAEWAHRIFSAAGAIWVNAGLFRHSTFESGALVKIDPVTNSIEATLPNAEFGTFDPGAGVIWTTAATGDRDGLARIDPETVQFVGDPIPIPWAPAIPGLGLIAGDRGGIWFEGYDDSVDGDAGSIERYNPATGEIDASVPTPKGGPLQMAVAPGSLWTVNYDGTVTRIDLG